MLVLETVLKIRREHAAGKAIKAIARDLKLSRKVVRKVIRTPEADFSYRREVQPLPRIGPFQEGGTSRFVTQTAVNGTLGERHQRVRRSAC